MKKLSVILILMLIMLFGTVVEARSYGSRSHSKHRYKEYECHIAPAYEEKGCTRAIHLFKVAI